VIKFNELLQIKKEYPDGYDLKFGPKVFDLNIGIGYIKGDEKSVTITPVIRPAVYSEKYYNLTDVNFDEIKFCFDNTSSKITKLFNIPDYLEFIIEVRYIELPEGSKEGELEILAYTFKT
jgi:hypothetical protein